MKFIIIESGSKGNATIVINEGRILLIDMGVSLKSLNEALLKINKNIFNIEGMLLTHEHSDHTKGIQYLPPLPIYTLKGTYCSDNVVDINISESFELAGMKITPIKTSHDVTNPCGFILEDQTSTLVYITDTGIIPKKTLTKTKNADYYIFESNHDVEMLLKTNRPPFLKKRILSNKGHLSNQQSAEYLSTLIGNKTKEIVLAHLSEEANKPQVAINTHKNIYLKNKINIKGIKLHCASQHKILTGGENELRRI